MLLYEILQDFRSFSFDVQFWFAILIPNRKSINYLKSVLLPKPEKDLVMMEFINES
jgi:hypothetical protein